MTQAEITLKCQDENFYEGVVAMYQFLQKDGNGMRTADKMIDEIETAKSEDDEL